MNIKDISDIVSKWVTTVAVIAGIIFAVNEFKSANSKIVGERSLNSLQFIKDFSATSMIEHRLRATDIANKIEENEDLSVDEKQVLSITVVLDFLQSVHFCYLSEICDKNILVDYFGPYARQYSEKLGDVTSEIGRMRKDSNFGYGAAAISHDYGVGPLRRWPLKTIAPLELELLKIDPVPQLKIPLTLCPSPGKGSDICGNP